MTMITLPMAIFWLLVGNALLARIAQVFDETGISIPMRLVCLSDLLTI